MKQDPLGLSAAAPIGVGGVGILGIGTYLPKTVRTNDFWTAALLEHEEEKRKKDMFSIEKTTRGERAPVAPEIAAAMAALGDDPFRGARLRRVLEPHLETSDMEAEAARAALAQARVHPDEIDMLMVASLVPDRLHPANGPALQVKCQLKNAVALSVDVACGSFQPQMVMAAALIRTGTCRRILLVLSGTVSRILDYSSLMSTAFGDGAAAVVVGAVPAGYGLLGHFMRTDGSFRESVVHAPIVNGEPQPRWPEHDGPVRLTTAIDRDAGKRAGLLSTEFCRDSCLAALSSAGLSLSDVKLFLANQGTGWFVDACRRGLGLLPEQTVDTFAEIGNIGPAVVPYNLDLARRTGQIADGDIGLFYSPGAGLTRTAMVYRYLAPDSPLLG